MSAKTPEMRKRTICELISIASAIVDTDLRTYALASLAPLFSENERPALLFKIIPAIRKMNDDGLRRCALVSLAPYFPKSQVEVALRGGLAAMRGTGTEIQREALNLFASRLPKALFGDAIEVARALRADEMVQALAALAHWMPNPIRGKILHEAVIIASDSREIRDRLAALLVLAPLLSDALFRKVWSAAKATVGASAAFLAFEPYFPKTMREQGLREALAHARSIEECELKISALSSIIQHLPNVERETVARETLAIAVAADEEFLLFDTTGALVQYLPKAERQKTAQSLFSTIKIEADEAAAIQLLPSLIQDLPLDVREDALRYALAVLSKAKSHEILTGALSLLGPHLSNRSFGRALVAARSIYFEDKRALALVLIAEYLPKTDGLTVRTEALKTAQLIENPYTRVEALLAISRHLKKYPTSDLVAAVRSIPSEDDRLLALPRIALSQAGPDVETWIEFHRLVLFHRKAFGARTNARDPSAHENALCALVANDGIDYFGDLHKSRDKLLESLNSFFDEAPKAEGNVSPTNNYREELTDYIAHRATDGEILDLMRTYAKARLRAKNNKQELPRWGSAHLPERLKELTAPLFLKAVYAELFIEGAIDKLAVREFDSDLMTAVEQYIGKRLKRGSGLGDAEGLDFISSPGKKRGPRTAADEIPAPAKRVSPRRRKLTFG